MRAPQVSWLVAVVTTGALTLAACTGEAEGKSGAEPAPTTLVLANPYPDGLARAPGVEYFVNRINGLSAGRMTTRVVSRWTTRDADATPPYDQQRSRQLLPEGIRTRR